MEISVIIPTYRPQTYLWKCLDSFCAQTLPKEKFEIVLVLNGTLQPYASQIEEYLSSHSDLQVHFLQTEQPGVSGARNLGLDEAKGRFVAFVDDDDYVSPGYLQELYESMDTDDSVAISYPYAFNDGEEDIQLAYEMTDAYHRLAPGGRQAYKASRKFFAGPCMKMIPMSLIRDKRFDVRFANGEDSLFMFLISNRFRYVKYTSPQAVYYRRFRPCSATTQKSNALSLLRHTLLLMAVYTKIYFSHPCQYSFTFYVTRILGAVRAMLERMGYV